MKNYWKSWFAPSARASIEYDAEQQQLICHTCRLKYRIEDDIPIMLVDEAEKF